MIPHICAISQLLTRKKNALTYDHTCILIIKRTFFKLKMQLMFLSILLQISNFLLNFQIGGIIPFIYIYILYHIQFDGWHLTRSLHRLINP